MPPASSARPGYYHERRNKKKENMRKTRTYVVGVDIRLTGELACVCAKMRCMQCRPDDDPYA